jgi:hypothetical protein
MNARIYKASLLIAAVVLLVLVSFFQKSLNRERARPELGLTRGVGLGSNAPPVLAFTTVALGGFRGLIANALWIRANDLQQDGKYFEMVQLADWITKLEPNLTQVWVMQAWNMAYNISVKFPNPNDRWRWVQRGIELLRDDGLRYNPREALMYRELAWFFQHKMGQNMDEAHMTYKQEWAKEMQAVLGSGRPNYPELLNPTTADARQRVEQLVNRYKMDPRLMKEADDAFGPLEWRLPEAHAIYWAYVGLKESKKKDLISLRRNIYQSIHMSVLRGRLISMEPFRYGPDLAKVDQANETFEKMLADETENPDAIKRPHRNWLREVIYVLYANNRPNEATRWFKYLREKYPEAIPPGMSLDEYALDRLAGGVKDFGQDKTKQLLEGLIRNYYASLIVDDDDRALGYELFARKLWNLYDQRIKGQQNRIGIPRVEEIKASILKEYLDPNSGLPPEAVARLRERLKPPASSPVKAPTAPKPG